LAHLNNIDPSVDPRLSDPKDKLDL